MGLRATLAYLVFEALRHDRSGRGLVVVEHPADIDPQLPFAIDDLAGQGEAAPRNPRLPPQAQLTLLALATLRWCDVPTALDAVSQDVLET
ncbi:MAG: hypothetical protein FJ306_09450, partial [Planctomycetes bacterium]|nr:hypothetical protein [Planctomycetota bacterium]